jgi:predicted O-methyltransferase YrrM
VTPSSNDPPRLVSDRLSIRLLAGIGLLRRDLRGLRHAPSYLRSLLPGHSPLADAIPMMTFDAIAWLRAYLLPHMHIFEYGSGGSTVFFTRRVERLVSIEHDPEWYARTKERLGMANPDRLTYVLRLPEPGSAEVFGSTDARYRDMSFESYVRAIDDYPDASFDLASVDGRARSACLTRAVRKVKPGGFVLLDNSDRDEYMSAMTELERFERTDFRGLAPYSTDICQTSVWEIKD